jgi:hypothetical protein
MMSCLGKRTLCNCKFMQGQPRRLSGRAQLGSACEPDAPMLNSVGIASRKEGEFRFQDDVMLF